MANPRLIEKGDYLVKGKRVNELDTLSLFKEGVFYTPSDRIVEGILPDGSIMENVLLGHQTDNDFLKRKIFIDWQEVRNAARKTIQNLQVKAPHEEIEIRRLSGGNIQRVIIGRALLNELDLFITHNTTSGLDVSSVEFIFKKLVEIRQNGGAVFWINEDLDELMILSDRIGVLFNGELKGIFTRDQFDKYKIGLLMIGG